MVTIGILLVKVQFTFLIFGVLDRMEIFTGMMITINAVHFMVWRLIVNLWLTVRYRHDRVVLVNDRLRLNGRPIVGLRVVERFRGRLIHWLNLGNIGTIIDWFRSMVDRFRSLINGFRSMVDGFRSMIYGFRSMVHGFRSFINGFRSLIDGFLVTQSSDVEMFEPTLYTVHSVTVLMERLRDIRWS